MSLSDSLALGKLLRRFNKAVRENARVSSRDFLHRLSAPTFPPVKCITEYSFDAVSRMSVSVGLGVEPLSSFRVSVCRAAC